MTTRMACPHCGFQNFSISAYCGRCERPLRSAAAPEQPPALSRSPAKVGAGAAPPLRPAGPRASPSPQGRTSPPGTTPAPRPVMATVAAPTPPSFRAAVSPQAEARPALTTPLEVPVTVEPHEEAASEMPVAAASWWRSNIARAVDLTLALGCGALVTTVEAAWRAAPLAARHQSALDRVVDWVHALPGPFLHGLLAALAVGLAHNLLAARRNGRTLGRWVTGTVLVRISGRRLRVAVVAVRCAASLISLALGGAGYFWSVVDPYHRTWHDLLAGTVLVQPPRSGGN